MESIFILAGLIVLAFPIIAIVALVKAWGASNQLFQIEQRLKALEARGVAPPAAATPPREAPKSAPSAPKEAAPAPEPIRSPAPPTNDTPKVETPPRSAVPPIARPAAAAAAAPAAHVASLEERFGTRWVVWVGGVALALGGIFLVRYSIEAGLIGPKLRLFFASLFAAALIATGEWTRRNERLSGLAAIPSAHIPGILTAAGTMVAYAAVYAAYALYGFLSPAIAFVALGAVALATLAAALLHGPALAALGIIGAYVTPLLVSSREPDYWALYIYLAVVTAAAFALARFRLWRWLAIAALVLAILWILPGIEPNRVVALGAHLFHAVAGFALAAALIVSGLFYGPPAENGKVDPISAGALGAYLLAAALLVVAGKHDAAALWTFAALAAATVAIAWRAEAATPAILVAVALTLLVMGEWALQISASTLVLPGGATAVAIPDPSRAEFEPHLAFGAAFAALFGISGFLAQGRSSGAIISMLWSAAATLAPVLILIALYYRVAGFERSIPFAGLALLLAALFAWATESLNNRAPRPGVASSAAIFATGAIAALALSLTFALEKGWLTISLALMVAGIAWISTQRPLPMLRWLAAAIVLLVLARIAYEPRIVGNDVGTTPILNWLLYGYGVPALSFWYAGRTLRARADDGAARTVESAAILFTLLLAFMQIRHFMNDGDVYRPSARLGELALQIAVGLAMTIGLEHVRARTQSVVHNIAAIVIAAGTLATIIFGLGIFRNPMVTGEPVGGPFFNLILLGYGLPAFLAIVLALVAQHSRPMSYRVVAAATAVILALAYLTLEVRTLYHGAVLTAGATSQAEQYTYSAVWLAFGVILLVAGYFLQSQPARLAAIAVLILTIAKVFLLDTEGLSDIYRVLSFIGLGSVLLGIGFFYQRLLFPARRAPAASPPGAPG